MSQIIVKLDCFSAAREAIKGLASDIAKLNEIPIKTRKKYFNAIDETMSLLDSALLLVIHRLGELLQLRDDEFVQQLKEIDYFREFLEMERSIRLCQNLRASSIEMHNILNTLVAKIALSRKEAVDDALANLVFEEGKLAGRITDSLRQLSRIAKEAHIPNDLEALRVKTQQARELFRNERNKLIQDQIEMMNLIC